MTGSGKTEVYFELIELEIKRSKQVLIMVPEISLTPQLENRFKKDLDRLMYGTQKLRQKNERNLAQMF